MTNVTDSIAAKLHELVARNGGVTRGAADMRGDAEALVATFREASGGINWRLIDSIPFTIKGSGNSLLLWAEEEAVLGYWSDSGPTAGKWVDDDDRELRPTHYAELSKPD